VQGTPGSHCNASGLTARLTFSGQRPSTASIDVLTGDPQTGNTLTGPDAIVPSCSVLHGSAGAFSYQVPGSSVTVVTVGGS
jgi:hypothetical protein